MDRDLGNSSDGLPELRTPRHWVPDPMAVAADVAVKGEAVEDCGLILAAPTTEPVADLYARPEGVEEHLNLIAKFEEHIPTGRGHEVEDITAVTPSSPARTPAGVNLTVDGGFSASDGEPALSWQDGRGWDRPRPIRRIAL